ncbi:hypothetical protein FE257_007249 [Aspergillus nanangensis]|uniref:Carboxylic ester hydrolase n=1 Tax=Aspergillus nanangensis TaxID=2582783 RepID=A0AAD4CN07_ASPNN|nr:hypothetical protein FE257_007249 [Aspergillus nanangensis]
MSSPDPQPQLPPLDPYYDLGSYHRPVSSNSPQAQLWFDRGLIWTYGFNHEEAAACFSQAIDHDPGCAMAFWGLAYTLGPNYNKPWQFFDPHELETTVQRTHRAINTARENATTAKPVESALIEALRHRYPQEQPPADSSLWNQAYADAMASVYKRFPDDLDVAALYADSMMNLTPWELWDLRTGNPSPKARTVEIKSVLDRALAQDGGLRHPGLLHLYIHLMEMSGAPETALTAADYLRGLVPDSGHLNHMPTHLDILCGDYRAAMASNSDAIRADEKFLARAGAVNFYTLYRSHDYHFRIYAAMFAGRSRVALDTAAELEASIPEELLRVESPPMADWLEGFVAVRIHVLVRFGRWQEIVDLKLPDDTDLYAVTTAMIHYARGVALAAMEKVGEAEQEQGLFDKALQRVPASRMLFNNRCVDILAVAGAMLDGEVEYRRGNIDSAFERLRHAIALDDGLPYDEPWGWMQPTRHAYGALLLEQGRVEDAAAVYSADLGMDDTLPRPLQHPNNVWALHGYHECLEKLGRVAEARIIKQQLKLVAATADVPISSSCYCRRSAGTAVTWLAFLAADYLVLGGSAADSFADKCHSFSPRDYAADIQRQQVQYVPAGTCLPLYSNDSTCGYTSPIASAEVCRIFFSVSTSPRSSVDLELWLPRNWSGRFLQAGNGGIRYDDLDYGTRNGFATAASNNGHDGKTVAPLYHNADVVDDFAWRALHTSVTTGKSLTQAFYASPPTKSYYIGCSLGGRQGIDSADRFPADFDGILAGSPAVNFNNLTSWRASFLPITGTPNSTHFVTKAQWIEIVHPEVLHQCDGIDGVDDGIITDPSLCEFRPDALLCGEGEHVGPGCLDRAQVETVRRVFYPLVDADGGVMYPAMQPGSEVMAAEGLYGGEPWLNSEEWFRYVVYNNPTWDPAQFTSDDAQVADAMNPGTIRTWPDTLSRFRQLNGKLIAYHGQQDEKITSFISVRLYEHLSRHMRLTPAEMDGFFRFFRVPGMSHCGGGPGASVFGQWGGASADGIPFEKEQNLLAALVAWVEEAEAPDIVLGTRFWKDDVALGVEGEREHCRYPWRTTATSPAD